MLNHDPLYGIIPLDDWKSVRDYDESEYGFSQKDRAKSILALISSVNPIPMEERRGRKSQSAAPIERESVLIPGIINSKTLRINYQKAKIAIEYIAKVLVTYGHSSSTIQEHPILKPYYALLPSPLCGFIDLWIERVVVKK